MEIRNPQNERYNRVFGFNINENGWCEFGVYLFVFKCNILVLYSNSNLKMKRTAGSKVITSKNRACLRLIL